MKIGLINCSVLWKEDVNGLARVGVEESDGTKSTFIVQAENVFAAEFLRVKIGRTRSVENSKSEKKEVRINLPVVQNGNSMPYRIWISPKEIHHTFPPGKKSKRNKEALT